MDSDSDEFVGQDDVLTEQSSSYYSWLNRLKFALLYKDCLGVVFHDIECTQPIVEPVRQGDELDEAYVNRCQEFYRKDRIAFGTILQRLDESNHDTVWSPNTTAKQLMDRVDALYRLVVRLDDTIMDLHGLELIGIQTRQYCERFRHCLAMHKIAVKQHCEATGCRPDDYTLPSGHIKALLQMGTRRYEWLRGWRTFRGPESGTLDEMMASLIRQTPPPRWKKRGRRNRR